MKEVVDVDIIANETVAVPKEEYRVLKEIYQSVKRQNFLLRIAEAEKNLKAGKVRCNQVRQSKTLKD
jgi:hypothetical protein